METNKIAILGNDKKVYEADYFLAANKTHKDAIGIIVSNPLIGKRVLAFNSWIEEWGEKKQIFEDLSEAESIQITCGLVNTKRIVEAQKHLKTMTAAKRCWNYKCGNLQWYLPSWLELAVIYEHRDEINSLMEKLGCDDKCLLPTENSEYVHLWSSCEEGIYCSFCVRFDYGKLTDNLKNEDFVVRAVAVL